METKQNDIMQNLGSVYHELTALVILFSFYRMKPRLHLLYKQHMLKI